MFALACIGIGDLPGFEATILDLKKRHRIQGPEIKSTETATKPLFVRDLIDYIDAHQLPVFIEAVDKHYFLVVNIVERLIVPSIGKGDFSPNTRVMKNIIADYLAVHGPNDLVPQFVNVCNTRCRADILKLYDGIIRWARKSKFRPDIADGIKRLTIDSMTEFRAKPVSEAIKRALPEPDTGKKGKTVWVLPNVGSFSSIYARLNHYLGGDMSSVRFFHDEQDQFDDIIQANKVLAESLSGRGLFTEFRFANYDFASSVPLNFATSHTTIGIQAADVLAGFVSRYIQQKVWTPEAVNADRDEAFECLRDLTDERRGTGINFVVPSQMLRYLGYEPYYN